MWGRSQCVEYAEIQTKQQLLLTKFNTRLSPTIQYAAR